MSEERYENSHLYKIRHSLAHVMAQAVLEKYPDAKIAIGPPIEDGFYYDFELPSEFSEDDLKDIEKRMRKIVSQNHEFRMREVSPDEAREMFDDQPYKLALIDELVAAGETLSTYRQDTFEDLCRGPHVAYTGQVPAEGLKLMSVAGAYWRGDEEEPMLQRILRS